jgi:CheY-like chemotaxis protein
MNDLKATILLVEDNEDDVFAMQRAIKKSRVINPLQIVTDGQQAVDYLRGGGIYANRAQFPLPFLIFLDLKLPYFTGFEILQWIRTQPPLESIIVVVLTGSAESRDKDNAYTLGARSYLVKPPTVETLNAVFDSLNTCCLSKTPATPASPSKIV